MTDVLIVSTGIANIASVQAGFRRVGVTSRLTDSATEVQHAERVMLPGVGAFGAGAARLKELGLDDALRERIRNDRPTMAICLGLQLLAESSAETPGVSGLGILADTTVEIFPATEVRVPQLGWNRVEPRSMRFIPSSGYAYFANSFRIEACPAGWNCAMSEYAGPFVAAVERGNVLACQFHPELSGPWGLDVLRRWAEGGQSC